MKGGESEKGRSGMVGVRRPLTKAKGWKKENVERVGMMGLGVVRGD